MKKNLTWLLLATVLILFTLTGLVAADPSIPAVFETQGLRISMATSQQGTLKEASDLTWQIATGEIDDTLDLPGGAIPTNVSDVYLFIEDNYIVDLLLGTGPGEVLYTTVQTERTTATNGLIDYKKNFEMDTANKVQGLSNIEVERQIQYDGGQVGQMLSTETLAMTSTGQFNPVENTVICPFASAVSYYIPPFCNKVDMGSDLKLNSGSVGSSTNNRFVSASGDYPVTADYDIRVVGIADNPADGKVSAYFQSQTSEGGVGVLGTIPFSCPGCGVGLDGQNDLGNWSVTLLETGQRSQIEVDDRISVDGKIVLFDRDMHYESGIKR